MKESKTIFFVFYSTGKKEHNYFPSFIKGDANQCEEENLVIKFLPLTTEKTWNVISFPGCKDIGIKVFSHGIKENNEELSDQIAADKREKIHVDYSSSDPSYDQMWKDISDAKNCRELGVILEYWMKSYVVDPLRRIKHRAINLFLPISTDIQFLLEIWRRKDFSRAKIHLEELKIEWVDAKSPVSILFRLWYMLVGKRLRIEEKGLPGMPADVSLPKDKEGNELPLYEWLAKYFGEKHVQEIEEWQKLLAHAQIHQLKEGKFGVLCGNGVYCFSRMITEMIKYPGNLKPNEKFNGFRLKNNLDEEFNLFLDWLNTLNDSLESLIKKCQEKS
jgi:hypothetical protein